MNTETEPMYFFKQYRINHQHFHQWKLRVVCDAQNKSCLLYPIWVTDLRKALRWLQVLQLISAILRSQGFKISGLVKVGLYLTCMLFSMRMVTCLWTNSTIIFYFITFSLSSTQHFCVTVISIIRQWMQTDLLKLRRGKEADWMQILLS